MKHRVLGIFAITIAILFYFFAKNFISKARGSEARTNLSSYLTAQKSYLENFGRYAQSLEEVGFRPEGGRGHLAISSQDQLAKEKSLSPYIKDADFKVYYIMPDQIWVLTPTILKRIPPN